MTWAIKPVLPGGTTFAGQIMFNITNYEISNDFKNHVESVSFRIPGQYEHVMTGFESYVYKKSTVSERIARIMMIGSLSHSMKNQLHRLAIGINGSGCVLQWKDDFIFGSVASPTTHECRWLNAGKFVDNSELLCGGRIDLRIY